MGSYWLTLQVYNNSTNICTKVEDYGWVAWVSGIVEPLFGSWSHVCSTTSLCFWGHHSCSVHMYLIIYGSKACPWSNESAGDRDILLEMHWMPQVYMMLNNAVQPDLANIYWMPAMCWARWGLWPGISHGLPFWNQDLWGSRHIPRSLGCRVGTTIKMLARFFGTFEGGKKRSISLWGLNKGIQMSGRKANYLRLCLFFFYLVMSYDY